MKITVVSLFTHFSIVVRWKSAVVDLIHQQNRIFQELQLLQNTMGIYIYEYRCRSNPKTVDSHLHHNYIILF